MAQYSTPLSPPPCGSGRGAVLPRGEMEQPAVAVHRHAIPAEDGVAEDAVDPRPGIVEHDRHIVELGAADLERREATGRARGQPRKRLKLDGIARGRLAETEAAAERRGEQRDARSRVDEKPG